MYIKLTILVLNLFTLQLCVVTIVHLTIEIMLNKLRIFYGVMHLVLLSKYKIINSKVIVSYD